MNAKHITDLAIENFRGFHHLELPNLQAVNLIVGRNNTGKTSLLEALTLIANPNATSINGMPGKLRANAGNVDKRYFRWLLRDSADVESGELSAQIGSGRNQLWIYRRPPNEARSTPLYQNPALCVFSDGDVKRLRVRLISVQHRGPNDLVVSFGNAVRKREGEELMHSILRAVDQRILRVRVDPAEEGNMISVDVGLTESIPLSQAGQGIYRLIAILSDLIGETPQVCLIDEIENGLHFTVHKQVWRGLAEISSRLGVQIFATTHSRECLEAAQSVFFAEDAKNEHEFAVIQLMRVKDRVIGKVLDERLVEDAIENDIELR